MLRLTRSAFAIVALAVAACSDSQPTSTTPTQTANANQSEGRGVFQRYVAIGTSISAGVQSDGLIAASQATSWPVQLAAAAGRSLSVPFIDGTGCRSPL